MKLSTRSTYGLKAIIALARNSGKGSVSLSKIAKDEAISLGYLERIFARLKAAGIVESEKGASGGYKLSGDIKKICVLEILEALEGEMDIFHCSGEKGKVYCSSGCECKASSGLFKVQDVIARVLKNMKLKDLL